MRAYFKVEVFNFLQNKIPKIDTGSHFKWDTSQELFFSYLINVTDSASYKKLA